VSFYAYQFLLVLLLAAGVSYAGSKRTCCVFQWLVFLVLFIPAALRYGIGFDYPNYVEEFGNVATGCGAPNFGCGFMAICNSLIRFDRDVQWMFAISSFLTCLSIFAFPRKGFVWCIIGFMATMYLSSYNAVRQELGIMFCVFAFSMRLHRRRWLPVLMVAAGVTFHDTVLIVLPLALLVAFLRRFSNGRLLVLLAALLSVALIVKPVDSIFSLVARIPLLEYYMGYSFSDEYMGSGVGGSGLGYLLWFVVWAVQGLYLLYNSRSALGRDVALWCLMALIVSVMGAQVRILARFELTTEAILPFSLLFLARCDRRLRLVFFSVLALVILSFVHDYGFDSNVGGKNDVLPYQSILDT